MSYIKTEWENLPSTNTAVNARNLNNIENGIEDLNTSLGDTAEEMSSMEERLTNSITINRSTITTTEEIAENTNYTIPTYYEVGADVLEIYYMGEKLVKGTHYIEVGNTGAISNTIQFYNWGQDVPANRTIEFVVRGVYSNES